MSVFPVKLYFSGSVDHVVSEHLIANDVHRLFTHAYPKEVFEYLDRATALGKRCRIMMDSGAFTAWNVGKPVQLRDLIAYNQKVLDLYGAFHDFVFISLDVIPGDRGRRPTSEELAKGIDQSKQNFLIMQQHFSNHKVLPVYHTGEERDLRDWYLDRCDYMCLSMDQAMSERDRLGWAKRAHVAGVDFHGLAATGNRMVTEIGWHSVDSSSWVTVGSMGSILWPIDGAFRTLAVSHNSPSKHDAGHHITTLTQPEQDAVKRYIESWGFDPEVLATEYRERWRWNIYQWCFPPWKSRNTKPVDLFDQC